MGCLCFVWEDESVEKVLRAFRLFSKMCDDDQHSQPNQSVGKQHAGAGPALCGDFVGHGDGVRLVLRLGWRCNMN